MIEDLITVTLFLFLSSMWCFGYHEVVKKFILLHIFNYDLDEDWEHLTKRAKFWIRPTYGCPPCMASMHGSLIYFIYLFPLGGWALWIPFCVCLCGLNYIGTKFAE